MNRMSCVTCGWTEDDAPATSAAVLRSLGSQYRSLFQAARRADQKGDPVRRRERGSWSALEHAAHVRDVLHASANRLGRFLVEDSPVIAGVEIDAPCAGDNDWHPEVVLAVLEANAERLARVIDAMPPEHLDRSGMRNGQNVTARLLAAEAVHRGVHHLVLADRTLADVLGRDSVFGVSPLGAGAVLENAEAALSVSA